MEPEVRPPDANQAAAIIRVKRIANDLRVALLDWPPGREMSLAATKVEEAVMWAVKGISR